jgi:hypothetical protein
MAAAAARRRRCVRRDCEDKRLKRLGERTRADGAARSAAGRAQPSAPRQETATPRQPGELNEPQKRRLGVTCAYIDRLLQDIEHILGVHPSPSPFARYIDDIQPGQAQALQGYIGNLREQLLRALAWQQMEPKEPEIPATRAVLINVDYIGIAIEELKPRYLRGSGAVPEDAAGGLNRVVGELRAAAESMEHYLLRETAAAHAGPSGGGQPAAPRDEDAEAKQQGGTAQPQEKEGNCRNTC